jgi:peptide/nickel transport system permease protein
MDAQPLASPQPVVSFAKRPAERGLFSQVSRRLSRSVPGMVGLFLIVVMLILSIGAPLFTDMDPATMDTSAILQAPSEAHRFGTDDLGRDVLSRVLYGGRVSIFVGVVVAGTVAITGVVFGILSGVYRRLDSPIMRTMDMVMAFPAIMLALGVVAILGPQLSNIIIALVIAYTPTTARVVRSSILQLKGMDFIVGARSIGAGDLRIMRHHLLPNSMAPLLVQVTYILGIAILAEAALTFLGVGVPPDVPTLGGIIADARVNLRYAPWLSLYPGLAISALVLGFNLLGDAMRDVLDPRMKM